MSTLYLKEDEIEHLVTVGEVIDALESTFRDYAVGRAFTNSRNRLRMPGGMLHLMAGCIPGYFGYKAYASGSSKMKFFFYLFEAKTSRMLAVMEADALGQIRTGAATGLATRILSNPDAHEATLFGAGWQAETQLVAMDAVRNLARVWIINRNEARREAFMKRMQPRVKTELLAGSAEKAVQSSQIVTTVTNSREPVLQSEWLSPGAHVNAAGGNVLLRREVDDETVLRADRVVVDSIDQAKIEAGEFVGVIESGRRHWEDFVELRDVVAGFKPGRAASSDITFFKSLGLAIEDVSIGKMVYQRALDQNVGRQIEIG
jgi:alanine dehydrogenase